MDSSATLSSRDQIVPKEHNTMSPATKYPSSRRTPSFSSPSSLSSCSSSSLGSSSYFLEDNSTLSPAPPTPFRFSGVPFSWEHLPGIPKKQNSKKKDSSFNLLPLPPSATPPTSKKFIFEDIGFRKKNSNESFIRDPFFAALVECSKDDHDHDQETTSNFFNGAKVSRSISDRFGFVNLYTSCKRTCAVSESVIYLPRSSRTSYDLVNRSSR